jgi:hypothetical protein
MFDFMAFSANDQMEKASDTAIRAVTETQTVIPGEVLESNPKKPAPTAKPMTVTFQEGPLGFRMMTAPDGTHIVVELTPVAAKGQAQALGLAAGDIILGINDQMLSRQPMNHSEVLHQLKTTPRPFTMHVGRAIAKSSQCVKDKGGVDPDDYTSPKSAADLIDFGDDTPNAVEPAESQPFSGVNMACGANGPFLFGGLLLMKQFNATKAGYLCLYEEKTKRWMWQYAVLREDGALK